MLGMYDYEDVGAAPYNEDCVQFPYDTSEKKNAAERENRRYVAYLNYIFGFGSMMPFGVSIKRKYNHYSAQGGYLSVIVQYLADQDIAANFAIFVESNTPADWLITKGEIHRLKCEWYGSPSWAGIPEMVPEPISSEEAKVKVTIDEDGKLIEIS